MKYKSELIKDIVDTRGHKKSSLHYESECIGTWIEEAKGAYPKLCDYESEWLNYINVNEIGKFPYETVTANPTATANNVVPYSYKSAILKGSTKYRDIDTGEILEAFEEGRNLELVSVKMPVLTTTGKNLFDIDDLELGALSNGEPVSKDTVRRNKSFISVDSSQNFSFSMPNYIKSEGSRYVGVHCYNINKQYIGSVWLGDNFAKYENKPFLEATKFVKITIEQPTGLTDVFEAQLEEGSTSSSYEPYKSNILTVNEEVELRGIGDVKDTLDCLTGELIKNFGSLYFDGSENWNIYNRIGTMAIAKLNLPNLKHNFSVFTSLADNIPVVAQAWTGAKGISLLNQDVYLTVEKSIANTNEDLKNWISNIGGINLIYQLSQITVKTVDLSIVNQDNETLNKIKPIEGTMNINVTGNPANPIGVFEIPVEAIIQNLESFIEEE